MLPEDELEAILRSGGIPGARCRRPYYRCVVQAKLYGYDLPSPYPNPIPLWSSSANGGRFTAPGSQETLYLAEDQNTAYMEVDRAYKKVEGLEPKAVPRRVPPVVIFSCDVELEQVLDLTENDIQTVLKTNETELKATWRLKQSRNEPIPTQSLGSIVYNSGRFQAIRFLSARNSQGICLAIFPDRVISPSLVEVFDPSNELAGRLPSIIP